MNKVLFVLSLLVVCAVFTAFPRSRSLIKVGDKAADFSLSDENGATVTLPKNGKVALVFFPKAHSMSFGCKKQVCSIRDSFSDLKQQGITVYGLTDSSQKNMKKFVENNHLPFTLLHATSAVMKAYGVAGGFFGAKRHTVLIDNGIIVCIIEDVDLANHPQQILGGFIKAVK